MVIQQEFSLTKEEGNTYGGVFSLVLDLLSEPKGAEGGYTMNLKGRVIETSAVDEVLPNMAGYRVCCEDWSGIWTVNEGFVQMRGSQEAFYEDMSACDEIKMDYDRAEAEDEGWDYD